MRAAAVGSMLIALCLPAGCHKPTTADAVQAHYDARADRLDNKAAAQPTKIGQQIYEDQADAIREEGKERAQGIKQSGANQPLPADQH